MSSQNIDSLPFTQTGFCNLDPNFEFDLESSLYAVDLIYEEEIPYLLSEVRRRHKMDLVALYEDYFGVQFPRKLPPNYENEVEQDMDAQDCMDKLPLAEPFSEDFTTVEYENNQPAEYYLFDPNDPTFIRGAPISNGKNVIVIYPESSAPPQELAPSVSRAENKDTVDDTVLNFLLDYPKGRSVDEVIFKMLGIPTQHLPPFNYKIKLVPFVIEYLKMKRLMQTRKRHRKIRKVEVLEYTFEGEYCQVSFGKGYVLYITSAANAIKERGTWIKFKDQHVLFNKAPQDLRQAMIRAVGERIYNILHGDTGSAITSDSDQEYAKRCIIDVGTMNKALPSADSVESLEPSVEAEVDEEIRRRFHLAMARRAQAPPIVEQPSVL